MQAIVTGCAGFIGSHLCERLLAAGHAVTGVDSFTEFYDPSLKAANLAAIKGRIRFLQCAVEELTEAETGEADWIFHLAGQPGVRDSWGDNFQLYVTRNIQATQHLLELPRWSRRLRKLVYASSSSVYGRIDCPEVDENYAKNPHSPYGVTKLAAEHLCSLYGANDGLPILSLRLFTVVGPRQRPDMMTHRLIRAALTGEAFPLFGAGDATRDFTSVHDVAEAFLLAAEAETPRGVFNISGGRPSGILEMVGLVEELAGAAIRLDRQPESRGDVPRTGADLAMARKRLGYAPHYSLRETVLAQVEHVRGQIGAGRRPLAASEGRT
jgi:UDP-glucuronate 4-epimerase